MMMPHLAMQRWSSPMSEYQRRIYFWEKGGALKLPRWDVSDMAA